MAPTQIPLSPLAPAYDNNACMHMPLRTALDHLPLLSTHAAHPEYSSKDLCFLDLLVPVLQGVVRSWCSHPDRGPTCCNRIVPQYMDC